MAIVPAIRVVARDTNLMFPPSGVARGLVPADVPGWYRLSAQGEIPLRSAGGTGEPAGLCTPESRAILGAMLDTRITTPGAWQRRDVRPEDYRVTLSPACRDELLRAADTLAANPLPTILLDPAEFDMPHCRAAMATAKRQLDQ